MTRPALPDLGCPLAPPDPDTSGRYAVDGVVPRAVALPTTEEQVASVLRVAHAEGLAVTPWGGGTRMALGGPPARLDVALDMSRLSAIVAHEPADLTVTVQAGATIAAVNAHLARSGQYLPLDPPLAERATVGGTLASDASGPLRQRYPDSSGRDMTLGVRVAGPDGVVTKAGGRVVKNVTGYDLTKLYIGSLGTLGVILEASFKVAPLPRSESTALARFATVGEAQDAALALLRRGVRPLALDILSDGTARRIATAAGMDAPGDGFVLAARFGGTALAVERMEREMLALAKGAGATVTVLRDDALRRFWRAVADCGQGDAVPPTLVTVASVLPTQVAAFMDAVADGGASGLEGESVARAGVGVVRTFWRAADRVAAPQGGVVARVVASARRSATALGGSLVVESCAPEVKRLADVWGPPGPDVEVMRRIKARFDPRGVLNPGRFVGGI